MRLVVKGQQRHTRAEDLLLEAAHVRLHVADDRRLDEPPMLAACTLGALAAAENLRALWHRRLDELENGVHLPLAHKRTNVRRDLGRVAQDERAHLGDQLLPELGQQAALHEDALRRDARLAACNIRAKRDAIHRLLEVSVVKYEHRSITSELHADAREVARGSCRSDHARFGAASQVQLCNALVLSKCLAGCGAVPTDNVEHSIWQARFLEDPSHLKDDDGC
mmetsp:Transcript_48853/g.104288  ORF Transcript_48853/g.104288 Transcript_48853/m.104288 type:complete len:223 (+) Transcript_48853:674-1342(+)